MSIPLYDFLCVEMLYGIIFLIKRQFFLLKVCTLKKKLYICIAFER